MKDGSKLSAGDPVEIVAGPFAGRLGRVVECEDVLAVVDTTGREADRLLMPCDQLRRTEEEKALVGTWRDRPPLL